MTAMIEALSFLGPHGPVAQDEQSCIYYDSLHAAGLCLGTIQARTHVQLALACQRSMMFAQRKLRLTMQHVYGHSGNLGNECADHAASFDTFGLTSNHNVATRWTLHNVDAFTLFDGCHNINEILERLHRVRMELVSLSQVRSKLCVLHRVLCVCSAFHVHYGRSVCCCSPPFPFWVLLLRTSNGQTFFIRIYRTKS